MFKINSQTLFALLMPGNLALGQPSQAAEALSPEEEAEELQKIMASQNGGMPADPEEMQALLMKARGKTNRCPPEFMRLSAPIKMMTMVRPNDGIILSAGVPFSQRFQTQFTWNFSNKKAAEFETMCMLTGGGSMMDQDNMSFCNVTTASSGRVGLQAQLPLTYGVKLISEVDIQEPDTPNMQMTALTLKKDFEYSHAQYQYQGGLHMLSYMQSITSKLTAGFNGAYVPMNGRTIWAYTARYDSGINSFMAAYNPLHPQEKFMAGVLSKPCKRLNLFTEMKQDQGDKTSVQIGYRARFQEGMITGTLSSNGKTTTVYKKMIDAFELQFNGAVDLKKVTAPTTFGISLTLGGGM